MPNEAATTERLPMQARSETGATGLEPATSGVTGHFDGYNGGRRSPCGRSIHAGSRASATFCPHGCVGRFRTFAARLLPGDRCGYSNFPESRVAVEELLQRRWHAECSVGAHQAFATSFALRPSAHCFSPPSGPATLQPLRDSCESPPLVLRAEHLSPFRPALEKRCHGEFGLCRFRVTLIRGEPDALVPASAQSHDVPE